MKILIGGSPCTHWSIAQTKHSETKPEGLGWELFKNYLIAKEKFQPQYFLYENNKSMAREIREQITKELGVEPILINSALVSAQSRQRLYWTNIPGVEQPEDRGIFLRDILESGISMQEKSYCLAATEYKGCTVEHYLTKHVRTQVAEPVHIGTIESHTKDLGWDSKAYGVNSADGKDVTLRGHDGGAGVRTGLYTVPIVADGSIHCQQIGKRHDSIQNDHADFENDGRRTLSYSQYSKMVEANYDIIDGAEIIIANGKIRQGNRKGSKQGKYVYTELAEKSNTISAGQAHNEKVLVSARNGEWEKVYEVHKGFIKIQGKQYPIRLADGYYVIRKLTVNECKRLQTVPDDYEFPVSNTRAYQMLGNGWTVDVIAHILSHAHGITTEPLEVLSMYDGMSCGRLALNKLGANIKYYYATEVDPYAIKTTMHNFPDTIQLGDAFQVREDAWLLSS